jgi:hypothetical protein
MHSVKQACEVWVGGMKYCVDEMWLYRSSFLKMRCRAFVDKTWPGLNEIYSPVVEKKSLVVRRCSLEV